MLTAQQKAEAQKKLKLINFEKQSENKIKETISTFFPIKENNTKAINQLIASLKDDPKAQRALLVSITNQLGPKIIAMERLARGFEDVTEQMKNDKERMGKQKLYAIQDKERLDLSIKEIKETIKKIQDTVKSSIEEEANKRQKIQQDMEKSLSEIQQKIVTFDKESVEMETQNQAMKIKKKQIEQKMVNLEADFRKKADQKDEQVKKEKQELMTKLQSLEGEVAEITEINKQFSTKQKANFDKKLSLYLKTKKFPEFSTSFENSAKTIDQCKEELLKGVQRLNDAKQFVEKYEKQSKEVSNTFLVELKGKVEKQAKVEALKKQKQVVRQRIIALQSKLKEKKSVSQAQA